MFTQTIIPNPNIACKPGWCLQYVRETFGQPAVAGYGSATAAWENSKTRHKDRDFPTGVWLPVYYGLANEPLGHIVLRAPDGSVYSTSDLSNTPHHHADLADLEAYYAYYGMPLTYRGWTEDVQGIPVIAQSGLAAMGTITQEAELSAAEVKEIKEYIHAVMIGGYTSAGKTHPGVGMVVEENQRRIAAVPDAVWAKTTLRGGKQVSVQQELANAVTLVQGLQAALTAMSKNPDLSAEQITAAVKAGLDSGVVTVDVNVNGKAGA